MDIKRSAWKNERSEDNKAYVPTNKEHLANILTHGVGEPAFYMIICPVPGAGSSCTVAFTLDVLGSHYSHPTVVLLKVSAWKFIAEKVQEAQVCGNGIMR